MKNAPFDYKFFILFPLFLVLFEFSVYIGNDLVQPAMITITEYFNVSTSWASMSMSLYILGGALLTCVVGPLSDRYGRRKTLLVGVVYFVLANLIIVASVNIQSFMVMRLIQGSALCFISSVGYVCIQEAFKEHTAIRAMALMANVSMIAPLLGPLLGAAIISVAPWYTGFLLIAAIAFISLIGLYKYMPETVNLSQAKPINAPLIWQDYKNGLKNYKFIALNIFAAIFCLPILIWIALSPLFLVKDFGLSNFGYAMAQIPVFGALIIGNIVLAKFTNKMEVGRTVYLATIPNIIGIFFLILAAMTDGYEVAFITIALSFLAFAFGLSFAVLYRITLMFLDLPKGVTASLMTIISMGLHGIGIEVFNLFYTKFSPNVLFFSLAVCMLIYVAITYPVMNSVMRQMRHKLAQENQAKAIS